jgi:hypothetical protein
VKYHEHVSDRAADPFPVEELHRGAGLTPRRVMRPNMAASAAKLRRWQRLAFAMYVTVAPASARADELRALGYCKMVTTLDALLCDPI